MATFIVMCCALFLFLIRVICGKNNTMWLLVLLLLGMTGRVHAQTWRMGDPAHGLKIVAMGSGCGRVIPVVQQLLSEFPRPVDWVLVVACDDRTWNMIQEKAAHTIGRTDYAFSDISLNYSYIRGTKLVDPDEGLRVRPAFILAHEASHVILRCPADAKGEAQADALAESLISRK